nr:serine acetyltransferase [Clostridium chromiireducens]
MEQLFLKLREDIKVNGKHTEKLLIIFIYRFGNYISYCNMPKFIKKMLLLIMQIIRKFFVVLLFKVEIPFECKIGKGLKLMHPNGIILNKNVIIGDYCTIYHQVTIGANEQKDPKKVAEIGNNVYIACGAKIIGNVIIEDNVKIGANAVVVTNLKKNVTAYCEQKISYSGKD